jgi:hypothetical protein
VALSCPGPTIGATHRPDTTGRDQKFRLKGSLDVVAWLLRGCSRRHRLGRAEERFEPIRLVGVEPEDEVGVQAVIEK